MDNNYDLRWLIDHVHKGPMADLLVRQGFICVYPGTIENTLRHVYFRIKLKPDITL